MADKTYKCPECDSDKLLVREVNSFWLNSGDFFCHSVKSHDSNAMVRCYDCDWEGERGELEGGA